MNEEDRGSLAPHVHRQVNAVDREPPGVPGGAGLASMNSANSAGTGTGVPSRLMQTKTNSAVAMRTSSLTRRAVCRMVKLVRP